MNQQTITLDLDKHPTNEHVTVARNDGYIGITLIIIIQDGGVPLTYNEISGWSFSLKIRRPQGGEYSYGSYGIMGNGFLRFTPNNLYVLEPGETWGYMQLTKGNVKVSTSRFRVTVLGKAEV
jgi:hypothetical protein